MESLRPWRKTTLQVVSLERWKGLAKEGDAVDEGVQEVQEVQGEQEVVALKQVGGHGAQDKAQAMQVSREGSVLKPIQPGERGRREASFYAQIASDPDASAFADFIPKYYGLTRRGEAEFLMMGNLTLGLALPCIMDVKIGARTWGPDSTPAKRAAQDASYSGTKQPFGFSVPGLSVYLGTHTKGGAVPEQVVHGKEFGRELGEATVPSLLPLYLGQSTRAPAARLLAEIFVEELQKIQALFQEQTRFHLFGSSLLFVYDAAACNNLTKEQLRKSTTVKMIDFAHVWPAEGELDTNYLNGVDNLIALFQKML